MQHLEDTLVLDDEQRELQEAAHRFAEEVLRPTGIELPAGAVVAPDSPLLRAMAQGARLGYTRMGIPVELGGLGLPPVTRYLVQEELAWGSLGITAAMFLAATHAGAALASGNPELIQEFALPFLAAKDASIIGCWAITEPDHGSDTLTCRASRGVPRSRSTARARGPRASSSSTSCAFRSTTWWWRRTATQGTWRLR